MTLAAEPDRTGAEPLENPIAVLRSARHETLAQFAVAIGVSSKGRVSEMEKGLCRPTVAQALAIERLSSETAGAALIDAASLNEDVAAARASDPARDADRAGWLPSEAEIEAIDATIAPEFVASDMRVVLCDICERRLDGRRTCSFADCPHPGDQRAEAEPASRPADKAKAA